MDACYGGFAAPAPSKRAERERADAERREEIERELDVLYEALLLRPQKQGGSYLSNARIDGRFVLRGCVLNFRTRERDMELLLEHCRTAAAAA